VGLVVLWWEDQRMAPYRLLHVWDLDNKGDRVYLSKATKVMETLSVIAMENAPGVSLKKMSIGESRKIFANSFDKLCLILSRGASMQDIDRKHYGEASYMTFYDMILKNKKRTLADATSITTA
jgi:hypothetical protein